jgi:DNA-binding CsgD family transcriptional regulator
MTSWWTDVRLVGREAELGTLSQDLHEAAHGRGRALLLEGEAGIGKTRLVEAAAALARESGFVVLRGSAEELDRTRPFGVLADALCLDPSSPDPERASLGALVAAGQDLSGEPVGRLSDGPDLRYRIVENLVALLERLSSRQPVLVGLEDLQWADPSTLLALNVLVRRLKHHSVALIGSLRASSPISDLARQVGELVDRGATRLLLGPLDDGSVAALASEVLGAPPGPCLRGDLVRAGGNPLFVLELTTGLVQEGMVDVNDGVAEAHAVPLPPNLRLMLLRRLSRLRNATVDVLRLAAVLGSSFEMAQLRLAARRSTIELMGMLEEAITAGVVAEHGDRLAFRHDLLREALYEDLPGPIRAGLHLEVGRALAEAGAVPTQVAEHLSLGAAPGDPQAIRWLHEAAAGALPRAPAVAVELLERAFALAGPLSSEADALAADLVAVRLWVGRITDAERLARDVLGRGVEPSLEVAVRNTLVLALLSQGRTVEAQREADEALTRLGDSSDFSPQLAASLAHARAFTGDIDGAQAAACDAIARGLQRGDDVAVCIALCALSSMASRQGRLEEGIAFASDAVARASESANRAARRFHCRLFLGGALMEADRFREAATALNDGLRVSEEVGSPWNLPMYHVALAWLRFYTGEWDDALADVQTATTLADEFGSGHGLVSAQALVAMIHFYRGDLPAAQGALARGNAFLADTGSEFRRHWLGWARSLVEEATGDSGRALATMEEVWGLCFAVGALSELPILGPDAVRLCLQANNIEQARAFADEVARVADQTDSLAASVAASRCRGLVSSDADVLTAAAGAARRLARPLVRAAACQEAGQALSRRGRRVEARAILREAAELYGDLGALRGTAAVEAELRALGVRQGVRGRRPARPATGWEALTPSELSVSQLAVQGLTNRQMGERLFLSPRTVETHLSHIFRKLGLSSRTQLVAAAAARQSSPPAG